MKSDDSEDEILFPGEESPKKLNSLKNENLEILEKLFYTIVTNYSIYSFNPDDYFLDDGTENFYAKNIFNKNDGYITPFVILPYRDDKGIIDIENERNIKADMLRVRSTDANLKQVISNSQFHFGYVYLPED